MSQDLTQLVKFGNEAQRFGASLFDRPDGPTTVAPADAMRKIAGTSLLGVLLGKPAGPGDKDTSHEKQSELAHLEKYGNAAQAFGVAFAKQALPAWGGGQFYLGPEKSRGIGLEAGYSNLMGLIPFPRIGLRVGGPDFGVSAGFPYVGVDSGGRQNGWSRNLPRGVPEVLWDKARGQHVQDRTTMTEKGELQTNQVIAKDHPKDGIRGTAPWGGDQQHFPGTYDPKSKTFYFDDGDMVEDLPANKVKPEEKARAKKQPGSRLQTNVVA